MRLRPYAQIPRRTISLIAATFAGTLIASQLVTASGVVGQQAAAPSCTLNIPMFITVNKPHQVLNHTLGPDCVAAGIIDASWEARSVQDSSVTNKSYFFFDYPTSWTLLDGAHLGRWNFVPTGARGVGDETRMRDLAKSTPPGMPAEAQDAVSVQQNVPYTYIQLATNAQPPTWAGVKPACNWVDFTAAATRYAPKSNGNVAHTGARGIIQFRPNPDSIQHLGYFTTDSTGKGKVQVRNPGVGQVRVWIESADTTAASSSSWKNIGVSQPC